MHIIKTYLGSDPETITFLIVDPVYGAVLGNRGSFIQDINFGQDLYKYFINKDAQEIGKVSDILFEGQEFCEFPWKDIMSERSSVHDAVKSWIGAVNKQRSCKMGTNYGWGSRTVYDITNATNSNFRALKSYFKDKPWRHNPGPTTAAGNFVQ